MVETDRPNSTPGLLRCSTLIKVILQIEARMELEENTTRKASPLIEEPAEVFNWHSLRWQEKYPRLISVPKLSLWQREESPSGGSRKLGSTDRMGNKRLSCMLCKRGYLLETRRTLRAKRRTQCLGSLREWCAKAKASGIRQLQAMAANPHSPSQGLLNYYKTELTQWKNGRH